MAKGFSDSERIALVALQTKLFKGFTYRYDKDKHGKVEYWEKIAQYDINQTSIRFNGDCEEFAMHALAGARQMGLNARLIYCLTELNEGHCICEVISKDQTQALFLDNRYRKPMTRSELSKYKFVKMSPLNPVAGDKRPWYLVK